MEARQPEPRGGPARDVVDYDLLFDCVHCGLCLEACPTYILKRTEMDSPRGRIYQMKALAEGRLDADADVVRHLDFCLGCRGCETACPSGVHYGALMEQTRGWLEENYKRGLTDRLRRWVIGELFPYPARLRLALAPLRMIESAGLRGILHRIMPPMLREWLELLPPLAGKPVGTSIVAAADGGLGSVAVHRGCVAQVVADSANRNAENLLARTGYKVPRCRERFAAARLTCTAAIANVRLSSRATTSGRSQKAASISLFPQLRAVRPRWPNTVSFSRTILNSCKQRAKWRRA